MDLDVSTFDLRLYIKESELPAGCRFSDDGLTVVGDRALSEEEMSAVSRLLMTRLDMLLVDKIDEGNN